MMRFGWAMAAAVLTAAGVAGAVTVTRVGTQEAAGSGTSAGPASGPVSGPATIRPTADGLTPGTEVRVWQAPAGLVQVPIWPHGAPNPEGFTTSPESVLVKETPEAIGGHLSEAVFDVTDPTMIVYPPRGRNTGAAMVVFPGGGFQILAITSEGTEICDWVTSLGMTCIVSKYRVPGSNDYWNSELRRHITPAIPRALQDAQRTIRLVRSRATELGIAPGKLGVIGFSAGGYLVAQSSNIVDSTYAPVDAVDRLSSRPDFAVALYPGHLCKQGGTVLDPTIHVTRQTPPTFLLQAWDDPVDPICNSTLYARALDQSDVPSEVHFFARGGHAFTMRDQTHPVRMWPSLVEAWLKETGVLPT